MAPLLRNYIRMRMQPDRKTKPALALDIACPCEGKLWPRYLRYPPIWRIQIERIHRCQAFAQGRPSVVVESPPMKPCDSIANSSKGFSPNTTPISITTTSIPPLSLIAGPPRLMPRRSSTLSLCLPFFHNIN